MCEGIAELIPRGTHEPSGPAAISSEGIESFGGGGRVLLTGTPYERGAQRGLALGEAIRAAYERRVLSPIRDGSADVALGPWKLAGRAIDPAPLALADLVNETRPLMRGLDESDIEELQGVADAAECLGPGPTTRNSMVALQFPHSIHPTPLKSVTLVFGISCPKWGRFYFWHSEESGAKNRNVPFFSSGTLQLGNSGATIR